MLWTLSFVNQDMQYILGTRKEKQNGKWTWRGKALCRKTRKTLEQKLIGKVPKGL
jgi:hypothetical protein